MSSFPTNRFWPTSASPRKKRKPTAKVEQCNADLLCRSAAFSCQQRTSRGPKEQVCATELRDSESGQQGMEVDDAARRSRNQACRGQRRWPKAERRSALQSSRATGPHLRGPVRRASPTSGGVVSKTLRSAASVQSCPPSAEQNPKQISHCARPYTPSRQSKDHPGSWPPELPRVSG